MILGSGFGASLLGMILAKRGKTVAIVDEGVHPRFTIGESSTPIADHLLSRLSSIYDIPEIKPIAQFGEWQQTYPEHNCGCKRGFTYFWHGSGDEFRADPNHHHELFVTANESREVADTQWYRPQLDHFLLQTAQTYGAVIHEDATIGDIEHLQTHQWRLSCRVGHEPILLETPFVLDASGTKSILLNSMNVPDLSEDLNTRSYAIYSHWDECPTVAHWRDQAGPHSEDFPYPPDDSVVHHLFQDGWLWQIRFSDRLTSIGFVFYGLPDLSKATEEMQWEDLLKRYPVLHQILDGSSLSKYPNRIFTTRRIQRLRESAAGLDWAALPFTVGFVDPLHSTGIAHTLSAVLRLSKILLDNDDEMQLLLNRYAKDVVNELKHIDRLVSGCYRGLSDFRIFSTWVMLYFAAATTYERNMDSNGANPIGFLCANDHAFCKITEDLLRKLHSDVNPAKSETIECWIEDVQSSLEPYNHVGLFAPSIQNMYTHTAAMK